MNTMGEAVGGQRKALFLTCMLSLFAMQAQAQDVTITNFDQLAQVALSANYSIYLPFEPWDWRAYPTDCPLWCDFTQMACLDSLPMSTNLMTSMDWSNIPLASVILTKNVLSGVTTVQSADSTDVVATIPASSDYQPGANSTDHWPWDYYVQATNNPDEWGLMAGQIPPPTVTLRTFLADSNAYYSVYQSNLETEAEAAAAASAAQPSASLVLYTMGSGGFMAMDEEDEGNDPCSITNDATPFNIVSITGAGSGNPVLQWQSCTDHVYVVQTESSLTPTSSWHDAGWMFGSNQTTSWTDTNAARLAQNFYRVVRANPTNLNKGIAYGWAVSYGLDPLDPNLASETNANPWAHGLTNLQVYENPSVLISNNYGTYNDGIPDWWRVMYFGTTSTNSRSCAACDPDNTFWSNLGDYLNGVNPTNPADALPLTFTIDGGTNPVASGQLNIQMAPGIVANYVMISENFFFTRVTNTFSSSFNYMLSTNVDGFYTVYLELLKTNGAVSSEFAQSVQVEQGAPVIWISSPTNGTTVGQRQIDVQGVAGDAGTNGTAPLQVTVNGNFANGRDTNGNWWSAQTLAPGTNTFVAVATGLAGLTATSTVSFIYDPTLATNTPNFTVDVTNTVTVGSNTTAIAVSGTIDDSNGTVQIIVLNASDSTVTNAVANAAVLGTNWWGNVPVIAGNNAVIVSAQNSNSQPATNGFMTVQNTNVFLVIDSPTPDTGVNGNSVLVIGHASANFNKTITINGVPALTSTDAEGIIFSNSVPLNNTDANVVEVDATGTDGSSATTRETCYGYELLAFHFHYHGFIPELDCSQLSVGDQWDDWDPSHGDTYHVFEHVNVCAPDYDDDQPCSFVCNSQGSGDVCLNLSLCDMPLCGYGPFEGDFSYFGDETGSWDSQITVIKHAPVNEEQLVAFHFDSLQYATIWADPMSFDPSQVTFRGAPGFWYIQNGQTNGVAFLIKVQTNIPFTIQASDFQFPARTESTDCPGCSGTSHILDFTGFGNHQVPTVQITGPQDLYVFCNAPTPQYPFTASVTPSEPGTFTWNSYHNGPQHSGYLTITPQSPPSAQPNGVFIQAVDVNHVSQQDGDTQVEVIFYPADGSPYLSTNFPVTVRKPWRVNQQPITYANYAVPPTNGLDEIEATITYTVYDQLCEKQMTTISGFPDTESVSGAGFCMIDQGNNVVQPGGYIYDTQTWEKLCGIFTVNQTINCDCATIAYSITTAQDPTAIPPYPRWYLNYTEQPGSNTCPP